MWQDDETIPLLTPVSAMLTYRLNSTDDVDLAIINAGGVRATIDEGPITRGEVLTSFPFGNAVTDLTLTGQRLWDTFEGIVSETNLDNGEEVTSFVQVSRGVIIEYNPSAANGSRMVSLTIKDAPVDLEAEYHLVTVDFVAGGGDNFFSPIFENFVVLDTLDEILTAYIGSQSPVDIALEGRIVQSNGTATDDGNGSTTTTGAPGPTTTAPDAATYEGVSRALLAVALLATLAFVI